MANILEKIRRPPRPAPEEATSNGSFAEDLVASGMVFGQGGRGGFLWNNDGGGAAADGQAYDRWAEVMVTGLSDRLDSPDDMVLSSKFTDPSEIMLISECMDLGDFQLYAPINNSSHYLHLLTRDMELQIQAIEEYTENESVYVPEDFDPSALETYAYGRVIIVDCPEMLPVAEERVHYLRQVKAYMLREINRAIALGHFFDYSYLNQHLSQQFDPRRALNAAKATQWPFFYRMAHKICAQNPGGEFVAMKEAILARVARSVSVADQVAVKTMGNMTGDNPRMPGGARQ